MQPSPQSSEVSVHPLFPHFVFARENPEAATINPTLAELAYQMRKQDPRGREISNRRGWQSNASFGQLPAVQPLLQFIERTMLDIKAFVSAADTLQFVVASCWANINGKGGYNESHIHGNSYFSGVYYVRTPAGSGEINFSDPNRLREYHSFPLKEPTVNNAFVQGYPAVEGRMYIFPGYLPHSVSETLGDEERISVSFNITGRMLSPSSPTVRR